MNQTLITILATTLISNSSLAQPQKPSDNHSYTQYTTNHITAGNLYLYSTDKTLSPKDLTKIKEGLEYNFQNIGIEFKQVKILHANEFPKLEGIDILMYLLDNTTAQKSGLMEKNYSDEITIGRYSPTLDDVTNLGYLLDRKKYDSMKEVLHYPYNIITSANNTGYVLTGENLEPACLNKKQPKARHQQHIERIIQIVTHETAHGLGASHILQRTSNYLAINDQNPNLFMNYNNCSNQSKIKTPLTFDLLNIQKMHNFIINTKYARLTPEELMSIRQRYYSKPVFNNP